jgi:hypothetical protein
MLQFCLPMNLGFGVFLGYRWCILPYYTESLNCGFTLVYSEYSSIILAEYFDLCKYHPQHPCAEILRKLRAIQIFVGTQWGNNNRVQSPSRIWYITCVKQSQEICSGFLLPEAQSQLRWRLKMLCGLNGCKISRIFWWIYTVNTLCKKYIAWTWEEVGYYKPHTSRLAGQKGLWYVT